MKKLIFLFLVLEYAFAIENCTSQWVQTSGPSSQDINSLLYFQGNVFAFTSAGIFRTTNNGDNWISAGLSSSNVGLLASIDIYLFASASGRIYRTSNLGVDWTLTNLPLKSYQSITTSGTTLFAGTYESGIYRTTDYGNTCDTVNTGITSHDITALGSFNGVIYCGTWNDWWVYKSTNNGNSWINMGLEGHILDFAFDGSSVMVGRCDTIFRTSNGGVNWYPVSSGVSMFCENTRLYQAGSRVFVSSCGKLFMTTNFGTNWIIKNQGLESKYITSFVATTDKVFAGTSNAGVWKRNLSEIIGVQNISTNVPDKFELFQNYPNPFNPVTIIKYMIVENGNSKTENSTVTLKVYNVIGSEVAMLVNEKQSAGVYEVKFDGSNLNSGVYFYKLTTGNYKETKKMLLIK